MAAGFPAYHRETYVAPHPDVELQTLALNVVQELGWKIDNVQPGFIAAHTALNLLTYGETIHITLAAPDRLEIHSKCSFPLQVFDWGKNRQNCINLQNGIEKAAFENPNPFAKPPRPPR